MNEKNNLTIEIIAVGSELLTPFYQDTNSLYITSQLNSLGLKVTYKTIVGDDPDSLWSCFNQASKRAHMIFVIGGLGPTNDDITREVFSEFLGREMEFRSDVFESIKKRFYTRGLKIASSSQKQASIIKGSEIIKNRVGTAPGMWIEDSGLIFILLPGPPNELKSMFESEVLPKIKKYKTGFIFRKVLKITGITESKTETMIQDLYPLSPDINLSFLSYPGQIEIHLTSYSTFSSREAANQIKPLLGSINHRLKNYIFSKDGEEMEEIIGKLLAKNKNTLSTAESCTGGLLGHRITNVPGSSRYFLQGVQVYSNESKIQLLGIKKSILQRNGAVSSVVARLMAEAIRKKSGADYGLSITGIAGPGGGTKDKPVGLVFTALSWDNGVKVDKNQFLGDRSIIKFRSTQKAMDMLRRQILFKKVKSNP